MAMRHPPGHQVRDLPVAFDPNGALVIARQQFVSLRHEKDWDCHRAESARSLPLPLVDNATDGELVDRAHSRLDSKPVALLRDAQHRLLDCFVGRRLWRERCDAAAFMLCKMGQVFLLFGTAMAFSLVARLDIRRAHVSAAL
jgi:hypothetical protein